MKPETELAIILLLVMVAMLIALPSEGWEPPTAKGCETVTIHNLDPRFVEQARVAAASRHETLEEWIVESTYMRDGYHLNSGFCK